MALRLRMLCCAVPPPPAEDMWHVYNLVREGDRVTATTFRKVSKDAAAGSESERIKLKLTVKVEGIEFDPEGEEGTFCFLGGGRGAKSLVQTGAVTAPGLAGPLMQCDY